MQLFLLSCQNWLKGDLLLLCFVRNSALNVWSVLSAWRCLTASHSPHAHLKLGTTVTAISAPADRAGLVNTKELFFPAFVFHASPCLGAQRTQSPEPGIMIELPAFFLPFLFVFPSPAVSPFHTLVTYSLHLPWWIHSFWEVWNFLTLSMQSQGMHLSVLKSSTFPLPWAWKSILCGSHLFSKASHCSGCPSVYNCSLW